MDTDTEGEGIPQGMTAGEWIYRNRKEKGMTMVKKATTLGDLLAENVDAGQMDPHQKVGVILQTMRRYRGQKHEAESELRYQRSCLVRACIEDAELFSSLRVNEAELLRIIRRG
jgi:hypothetical protein